jgi:hypothetical protein
VRPGAYPRVEHLKGASLEEALALPNNISISILRYEIKERIQKINLILIFGAVSYNFS